LNAYLFGSLSTVAEGDLIALGALCLGVVIVVAILGRELFAVSLDPDVAAVQGIRVRVMSTLMAVLAAVVVVVGMRVVGLLLVSAIMIVPVAAAQQVTRSFRATALLAIVLGFVASVTGLVTSFYVEVPPGPTIVIIALASFAILAVVAVPVRRRRAVTR
jgi:zinc transport system permease protein